MHTFAFEAIGTTWSVAVDDASLQDETKQHIREAIDAYDKRFSRFISTSEVCAFYDSPAGTYQISHELSSILERADRLRTLTGGGFDPAVAVLLQRLGYDATYALDPHAEIEDVVLPEWSVCGTALTISGPIVFDIGGTGKGECIDMVVSILREHGHRHFLVEAGGDMYGSSKKTGEPWRVAIEYPGKPGIAAGTVLLTDAALAVSDGFRRRWGKWHHLIDLRTKEAVSDIIGTAAIAPSAYNADAMTSGVCFGAPEMHESISVAYDAAYVIFYPSGKVSRSEDWAGELI